MPVVAGAAAAGGGAGISAGTKAVIGLAATGTAVQAYGQYQAGKQAQQQAKSQAAWNRFNAKVSQRQAQAEQAAALFESQQQKKRGKILKARQRVLRGVSGVTPEGSPLLVMEDTAAELAKEEQNIRLRGQQRVSKLRSLSILDISKASAAKTRARGFGRAAITGAGSTILGGTSDIFFKAKATKG